VLIRMFRVQRKFSAARLQLGSHLARMSARIRYEVRALEVAFLTPAPRATAAGVICFVIHRHVSQASARRRREGHEASDQT
jgi:hypothetical protein